MLCKYNFHKWVINFDIMYNEHTRTCVRCGKKQYAKEVTIKIKYQDDKPPQNGFKKTF